MLLAVNNSPGLAALDLFEASDYAVMARYDLHFWPGEEAAEEALALAVEVKRIVLEALADVSGEVDEAKE